MDTNKIMAKLRGIRAERNLDLKTLGNAIGVHRSTLSIYELNKRKMPLIVFLDILKFYEIKPEVFFEKYLHVEWISK